MRKALVVGLLGVAVFGTGAAGLVYQVVFERYLSRIVGSDHVATGLTLAVFLGGLALGYALCGRLTSKVQNHLRVYAMLEASIGIWALTFPWVFRQVSGAVASWSFATPWWMLGKGLVVASVLILPPTLAMGATVPFLTRAVASARGQVSRGHATVYGLNTAGAFVGVLAAGFALVPAYGMPGTLRLVAWVNLGAAVVFALASLLRRVGSEDLGVVPARPRIDSRRFSRGLLYFMACLNGTAVLMFETSVVRFGKLALGSSSFTFAMVVAVFVLAIALGALTVARARKLPGWLLFSIQTAGAVYILLLYLTLDDWPYYAHVLRIAFQSGTVAFFLYYFSLLVALLIVLVVPVSLLGATLPLLFHELDARVDDSGRASGNLLAWNGLGTLLGSIGGGFLLYAFIDGARIFLLTPLLASLLAFLASRPAPRFARAAAVLLLALSAGFFAFRPFHDVSHFALGTFRSRAPLPYSLSGADVFFRELYKQQRLVTYDEDPFAAVAVLEKTAGERDGPPPRSLTVNGKSESDTAEDAETIRLLAHLPALWASSRDSVLVIGLGTGVTAGELTLYDDVGRIDVAEISPAAIRALPRFAAFTNGLHTDPRLRILPGDALVTLRNRTERLDLVISEPSNPWVSGADQLFTVEFHELVRSRLTPDGLFVQWFQLYETEFEILALVLNSLTTEFSTLHAFRGSDGDLLLLAAQRPFTALDRQRAEVALARLVGVRSSLEQIGITSIGDILKREITTLPSLLLQGKKYGVNSMDRPRLQYLAGRALFDGSRITEEMLDGVVELDFPWSEAFEGFREGQPF